MALKFLVIGRRGQLARAMQERAVALGHSVHSVARPDLDLLSEASVDAAISAADCDVVVNAAAYTAVDQAEREPDLAFAINATGAGYVARAANRRNAPVIHISTDYVFDGVGSAPRLETDEVGPLNVYGHSKLAGEHEVRAATDAHAILRTSWVFSPYGGNFLATMLRLAASRNELSIVADQVGAPTHALDLADAVIHIASQIVQGPRHDFGVFHATGSGYVSWADFASAIFRESAAIGGPCARVIPITSEEYPTPARRPLNSRLSNERLLESYGIALPHWQDALKRCMARLAPEITSKP